MFWLKEAVNRSRVEYNKRKQRDACCKYIVLILGNKIYN